MSDLPLASIYCEDMTWIGLVLTSFGAAMRDPVTMISCSTGSAATPAVGACWAMAGICMAATHTPADKVIVNRFTNDLTPIGFRILILVSLE